MRMWDFMGESLARPISGSIRPRDEGSLDGPAANTHSISSFSLFEAQWFFKNPSLFWKACSAYQSCGHFVSEAWGSL